MFIKVIKNYLLEYREEIIITIIAVIIFLNAFDDVLSWEYFVFQNIWQFLNLNFVSTTIGTLIGAYVAFLFAIRSDKLKKEHLYGVMADQVAFEWKANSIYGKEIMGHLESGYSTVRRFNLGMAELALGGSGLYEFAPKEFISKLRVYRENIMVVNRLMDYYFEKENNTKEDIDKLKKQVGLVINLIEEIGILPMR